MTNKDIFLQAFKLTESSDVTEIFDALSLITSTAHLTEAELWDIQVAWKILASLDFEQFKSNKRETLFIAPTKGFSTVYKEMQTYQFTPENVAISAARIGISISYQDVGKTLPYMTNEKADVLAEEIVATLSDLYSTDVSEAHCRNWIHNCIYEHYQSKNGDISYLSKTLHHIAVEVSKKRYLGTDVKQYQRTYTTACASIMQAYLQYLRECVTSKKLEAYIQGFGTWMQSNKTTLLNGELPTGEITLVTPDNLEFIKIAHQYAKEIFQSHVDQLPKQAQATTR
jgi:hypothetical protein